MGIRCEMDMKTTRRRTVWIGTILLLMLIHRSNATASFVDRAPMGCWIGVCVGFGLGLGLALGNGNRVEVVSSL
jgi:phosphate/sulfate permease